MSKRMTLALAATAFVAFSASAFAQDHGHGRGGGSHPGRGGGGGLVSQGGGKMAPNFSPRGGGGQIVSGGPMLQGRTTYTPRTDYRRFDRRHRYRSGGWWGPAIGFGIGTSYPYWGYGGYGYGWDDYYYDVPSYGYGALGGFCATRVRTCQLYDPAPIGAPCSCRIPGGRARGSVVP